MLKSESSFNKNLSSVFISIIIPVYNAKMTIASCLESVLLCDYPKEQYEVIVIDDGSYDNTEEIVKKYPVMFDKQMNKGPGSARNKAASSAQGDILLFLDADCTVDKQWITQHVEEQLQQFEKENQYICLGGKLCLPDKKNSIIEIADYYSSWYEQPHVKNTEVYEYLPSVNMSIGRKMFLSLNGFNEALLCGEDVEFGERLRDRGCKLVYDCSIQVFHYGRVLFKSFLYHHYSWGLFAPEFRKFGSARKYSWLFYPNRFFVICIAPCIAIAFTFYVLYKWMRSSSYRVLLFTPLILISKGFFAAGVISGVFRLTGRKGSS